MPEHRLPIWLKRVPGRSALAYAAVVAVVAGGSGTTAWALAGTDGPRTAPVTDAVRVQQNPRADRDHQRVTLSKKATPKKATPKKAAPKKTAPKAAHEELGSSMVTAKKAAPKTAPAAGGGGGGGGATCEASMYGTGTTTASGEPFDAGAMTAAHKTLPFGTKLRVTNTGNGDSVVVKVNDRGPFVAGRCLDLTTAAFSKIASAGAGVAKVHYTILSKG